MTRLRLRPGLTIRPLPDGDAVIAAGEGDSAVIVNASAHAVLDLLTGGGATEPEIVDFMCRASIGARDSISTMAPCGATEATIWSQLRAVVLVEKNFTRTTSTILVAFRAKK